MSEKLKRTPREKEQRATVYQEHIDSRAKAIRNSMNGFQKCGGGTRITHKSAAY